MPLARLLVSFRSRAELVHVEGSLPDWVDLKDPEAGPLGCPSLDTAREFIEEVERLPAETRPPTSLALGELVEETWHKVVPIARRFDFVKIALSGCESVSDWQSQAERIPGKLEMPGRVIATYYADRHLANAPTWQSTLAIVAKLGSPFILIDTYDKRAGRLWDWCSRQQLRGFVAEALARKIQVALAGSLQLDELPKAVSLGAAVVGVRGAVCENGSRVKAIDRDRLTHALDLVRLKESKIA